MRIAILTNHVPSRWAHSVNTMKHANEFLNLGHDVIILVVLQYLEFKNMLLNHYKYKQDISTLQYAYGQIRTQLQKLSEFFMTLQVKYSSDDLKSDFLNLEEQANMIDKKITQLEDRFTKRHV